MRRWLLLFATGCHFHTHAATDGGLDGPIDAPADVAPDQMVDAFWQRSRCDPRLLDADRPGGAGVSAS